MSNITINPAVQSNFSGSFYSKSDGYTQGDDLSDPNLRQFLRPGIVISTATQPMWGGLAVSETLSGGVTGGALPMTGQASELASILAPATSITGGAAGCLTGFTVFRQSTAMIQSAQSRVPMAGPQMAINFYRTGTKARVVVQALLAAAQAWAGGVSDPTTIYWDTTNLWVTNSAGGGIIGPLPGITLSEPPNTNNSNVVSYSSGTGFANWTATGAAVVLQI